MTQSSKEIIKYISSIFFSLFPNRTFRLYLYKDTENNCAWMSKEQAYWQPIDMGKKPQYQRVTCDTSKEALDLAREGATHRNNGKASVTYSPQVQEEVSYIKAEQGFKAGELNCIIASQGTGKSMVGAYMQARNVTDDVSL